MLTDNQEKITVSNPILTWRDGDALDMDRILFSICVEDVQHEALEKVGRLLTDEEINEVKDGLEWGLLTMIDDVYGTILYDTLGIKPLHPHNIE